MRTISYIKTDPTKNLTLLIKDPIPVEEQLPLASLLIGKDHLDAEQAGFFMEPANPHADARLRMMAGEFCGNATMSVGAVLAKKEHLPFGETKIYQLEISGAAGFVGCQITTEKDGWRGMVDMPLPEKVTEETFLWQGKSMTLPVVYFDGIAHIIRQVAQVDDAMRAETEDMAALWEASIAAPAFGILLWQKEKDMMDPFVVVKGGSRVWESSCGSGTCAIGSFLAKEAGGKASVSLQEPGGELGAEALWDGEKIQSLRLMGHVKILEESTYSYEES